MERGLYIAASGMLAEQVRQDQIANDLANASTPGYKADRSAQASFADLLLQNSQTGQTVGSLSMQAAAQAGLGGATINTAYSQLVTQLGSDVRDATQTTDNATILAGSLDDKRQSVSGVSLDEEMTNLVKFQRGYQASSRALSAMDEMIDQLINRTGKVGL